MFNNHAYFLNRELSWLKFNARVLQESDSKQVPLLERLKFIGITSSNLDEFFMVRVAGLKNKLEGGLDEPDPSGMMVVEQLNSIADTVHEQVKLEYRYLKNILRELERHDIYFSEVDSLPEKGQEWVHQYFINTIYPVLTPMAVDASHPFPFLSNRSLNLALVLERDGEITTAVVQVPSVLPRIVEIPGSGKKQRFVFLEEIIKKYCCHLFYGYMIKDIAAFRITRDADLTMAEDEAEDLLATLQKSLRQRKRGHTVRLEIDKNANQLLKDFLSDELEINNEDIYEINGPIDATCFIKFAELPGHDHLRYGPLIPQVPADLANPEGLFAELPNDLFSIIHERDILLYHPYESFEPVIEFVRQAANDPKVLAIKQTLYRVSGNSPIVRALAQAAENGKQVTVLVELKARFDEENNIQWARRLEEAGCHVIYGLMGLKTHGKIILVVRQESSGIKRYVHMGTGNYNDATAKVYTDIGLFTANDQIGADASAFFNVLSGYSDPPVWNKIFVAPLGLREKFEELIAREIEFAKQGKAGRIIAKMNALVDIDIIKKLYEASRCGVKIELIVRGTCVLRPGIPEVSENITVRSIVGRFLEHSRIYYFANGGDERVYLSSADWMPRNLNERVELLFPVDDEKHIERLTDILELMLKDNQKAYVMRKDGSYRHAGKRDKAVNSQMEFYRQAQQAAQPEGIPLEQRLKPMYRRDD